MVRFGLFDGLVGNLCSVLLLAGRFILCALLTLEFFNSDSPVVARKTLALEAEKPASLAAAFLTTTLRIIVR